MTCDLENKVKVTQFELGLRLARCFCAPNLVRIREIFLQILSGNQLAYIPLPAQCDNIIRPIFQTGVYKMYKIGQWPEPPPPYGIWTTGMYTPNLVILARLLLKWSWLLCDLENGSSWPRYNPRQVFHERYIYLHTKFPVHIIRAIAVMSCFWQIHEADLCDLKVGQCNPDTIPSRLSMTGTYTPNLVILVILGHSPLKLSW